MFFREHIEGEKIDKAVVIDITYRYSGTIKGVIIAQGIEIGKIFHKISEVYPGSLVREQSELFLLGLTGNNK